MEKSDKHDYVIEFEKLIAKYEEECRRQKHENISMRIYDVAHLRIAYLCPLCDKEFREAWNKKLKEMKKQRES
ncbi:MAG: hypothetical protein DRP02_11925 [Candidatus Gerdarchaeota archaeon]|nr:MAG: hypothetical protein DRP02_11925 [Candidatus Gerdarchaeota archaeon]